MIKTESNKIISPVIRNVFFLCSILCVFLGYNQNYDVSTIKVNNNNFSIYLQKKLYLDDDGFLWYSTRNGLVKEMGNRKSFFFEYAFDKTKHEAVLTTSKIFKSSKDELWSATNQGLNCLSLKTGTSKWIELNYPNTNRNVLFTDIAEDELGNLWFGTDKNYIFRYTPNNNFLPYKLNDSEFYASDPYFYQESKMKIETILEDNSLVIYQDNKWIQFKNEQSKLLNTKAKYKRSGSGPNTSPIILPDGALFESKTSGTYLYKGKSYYYNYIKEINRQVLELPFENAKFIPKKASKNFYHALNIIATDAKQFLGFKMTKKNAIYSLALEDSISFKHRITNIIYDPDGYFWLHTEDGLHKIRYNDIGFKTHINNENISCRGFAENSQGTIYVYTYQGVFKKEAHSETFTNIDLNQNLKTYDFVKRQSYNFYNQNHKIFWFYGFHNSLIAFNIEKGTFKTYPFPYSGSRIVEDELLNEDILLLASDKGMYSFNFKTRRFKNESILNNTIDLRNESITCITLSKDKSTLWIATLGDLALIKQDLKTKKTTVFNNQTKTLPILDNTVKIIYEDAINNLWLGTSNGLQKFNPQTLEYTNFTSLNGFSNGNIAGILEEDNNMWVSTYNGLMKVNKKTQSIQTYYETDGLTHNEFNTKSNFKSSDNTFYFGGLNGITSFNPDAIANKSKTYKIMLTDYQFYDKALQQNISVKNLLDVDHALKTFHIPYQKNYLTLNFSINDLFNAENNIYQYRIKELSEDWIDLGNYSKLELRGMNPGDYNLEVQGFSSNGNATNILKYQVNIKQIFYKELWFVALIILLIFTALSIRNRWRRSRLKNEFELKSKIQELESKAMRAQMNPHFIFNTLNGMQSVMILKGEREANKYFSAFSKLLRSTLDMSNSEYVLLKNEISYLKSYLELENLRLDNKINIEFEVDPSLDINNTSIPCMLFQPILENAIIHGLSPKKEHLSLKINFKLDHNKLHAEIIDNGIGRAEAMKIKQKSRSNHKSWATHIMNERIDIANAINDQKITWEVIDLHDKNSVAQGTKVIIFIPLKENIQVEKTE